MVRPRRAHTAQRFVYHQNTHNTSKAVRLRDVRLYSSYPFRTRRSDHHRRSGQPNHLVVAEEIIASPITSSLQHGRAGDRHLARYTRLLSSSQYSAALSGTPARPLARRSAPNSRYPLLSPK